MQPLKDAEKLPRIIHVETNAVVAHEDNVLAVILLAADLDAGRLARARIFHGVRNQIRKHDPQ